MPSSSTPTTRKPRPSRAKAKGPTASKAAPPLQPANKPVSPVSAWKKKAEGVDIELPSGNVCKVIRPGMPELIAQGVFGDSILPVVQKQMNRAQGKPVAEKLAGENMTNEIMSDPGKMAEMMRTFDKVLVLAVQEPPVRLGQREVSGEWITIPAAEREDGVLYSDWVDMDDKTFIFQYVAGGTADLATFRSESSAAVAAVQDGEDVLDPSV